VVKIPTTFPVYSSPAASRFNCFFRVQVGNLLECVVLVLSGDQHDNHGHGNLTTTLFLVTSRAFVNDIIRLLQSIGRFSLCSFSLNYTAK
jgi:hypothetical protein